MSEPLDLPEVSWRRVSPRYVIVDLVGSIIFGVVLLGVGSFVAWVSELTWVWLIVGALALLLVVNAAFIPGRVRAIGYQLRDDDLLFRRGLMFQRFVSVPYGRMQLVDINRGPVARAVGLSELRFVTAAAATNVVIPGLPAKEADELRDALVALAESRRAGL